MNVNTKDKVGARNWLIFIIIGLAGQLAWSLENMYLNNYIFDQGYGDYQSMITWTTALSAITACLTTIFMGGLSDKVGKRKPFIIVGYLLWGLSTGAFALVDKDNLIALNIVADVNVAAFTSSILIIILDCVMTFFGSTSNDACFNSYVTKSVSNKNRGKVEGVLSVLPLLSMLLITVLYSIGVKKDGTDWSLFFYIVGGFVFVVGLVSIFLFPKETTEKSDEKYFSLLLEGFKPRVIKENKILYIILIADFIYCMAAQIFFPYMMIYFSKTLEIVDTNFMIFMGSVLIISALLAVFAGRVMDKVSKFKSLIIWVVLFIVGMVMMFFVQKGQFVFAIISGIIMMFGYIVSGTAINASIREYTPVGKEGSFQGIRMIFQVALPMVTGPLIGEAIVDNLSNASYVNDFGQTQSLPPNYIWLFAALALLLFFIPAIILIVRENKNKKLKNDGIIYDQDK